MSAKATEVGDLITSLARRWAGQRVNALNSYRHILTDYGTGAADTRKTASAVARLTAEEVVRYPAELMELASDYASGVAKMAGLSLTAGQPASSSARPVHDIALSGKIGDTVTAEFLIENPRDEDVTIDFAATAFANDERVTKASPVFDPGAFTMSPRSEQKVAIKAKLDGRTLKAGERYSAQAIVDGFDDMVLRLNLTVDQD